MPKRLLFSLVCLVAVGGLAPAVAKASTPVCGEVITQSTTFTSSLTNCSAGLVVGADSITVDLNGYALAGSRTPGSVGIDVSGRSGVTIRNGVVRGFDTGVRVFDVSGSTVRSLRLREVGNAIELVGASPPVTGNDIIGNTIVGAENGIVMSNSFDRVSANTIVGASAVGILCRDGGSSLITGNVVTTSATGIVAFFCTADLLGNVTYANSGDGIFRGDAVGRVERNVSNQNGRHGINSIDSHANFLRNITIGNRVNGLVITDLLPDHGQFHTVTGHVALANGEYGIFTALAGVLDGGGNVVRANGNSAECFGFPCS